MSGSMDKYILLSIVIFGIGTYGVLVRRNLLVMMMSLELMLNGVNIALVAFSRHAGTESGHVFVLMVIAVAAAEVAVGLALVIALFRNRSTVDAGTLRDLQG